MTTLPPLASERSSPRSPMMSTEFRLELSKNSKRSSVRAKSKSPTRILNKRDRKIAEKNALLRSQQPALARIETTKFRYSIMHSVCLEILAAGFHKTFAELYDLVNEQQRQKAIAVQLNMVWSQRMLEDTPAMLLMIKDYRAQAEDDARKNEWTAVYDALFQLATNFEEWGDLWLSDFYYIRSLEVGERVGSERQARAHRSVALAQERNGDLEGAIVNLQRYRVLSKSLDSERQVDACRLLHRVLTARGEQQIGEPNESEILANALEVAQECSDNKLEMTSSIKIGRSFLRLGSVEMALRHFQRSLELATQLDDPVAMGDAFEGLARVHNNEREKCLEHLESFVAMAERGNNKQQLSNAYSAMGTYYNMWGDYTRAADLLSKAYNLSRSINEKESVDNSRIAYGITSAHHMLKHYSEYLRRDYRPCIERIIAWKNERKENMPLPPPPPKTGSGVAPAQKK